MKQEQYYAYAYRNESNAYTVLITQNRNDLTPHITAHDEHNEIFHQLRPKLQPHNWLRKMGASIGLINIPDKVFDIYFDSSRNGATTYDQKIQEIKHILTEQKKFKEVQNESSALFTCKPKNTYQLEQELETRLH